MQIEAERQCTKCKIGLLETGFEDANEFRRDKFENQFNTRSIPMYSCDVYYCPKCFRQFIDKD